MGKKKQSKSGAKKKRKKKYAGPVHERPTGGDDESDDGGGAMQGMVKGFRSAVGVESKKQEKKKGWMDHAWTILLILAVGAVLFYRFGMD